MTTPYLRGAGDAPKPVEAAGGRPSYWRGRHSMTDYVMDQEKRMKFLEDLEGRKKQLEDNLVEAHQDATPEESVRRLEGRIEEVERLMEKLQEDKLYEYFQR